MSHVPMPIESIARVDLLLGRAAMLTADRWDEVVRTLHEAMGIALLMAAARPSTGLVSLPGLRGMSESECIDRAFREVCSWDLELALDLPDLARLRVLLSELRPVLTSAPERV